MPRKRINVGDLVTLKALKGVNWEREEAKPNKLYEVTEVNRIFYGNSAKGKLYVQLKGVQSSYPYSMCKLSHRTKAHIRQDNFIIWTLLLSVCLVLWKC